MISWKEFEHMFCLELEILMVFLLKNLMAWEIIMLD